MVAITHNKGSDPRKATAITMTTPLAKWLLVGGGPNPGQQNKKKLGCRVGLQTDLFAAVMQDQTAGPLVTNQMPHHWGSPQQGKTKKLECRIELQTF